MSRGCGLRSGDRWSRNAHLQARLAQMDRASASGAEGHRFESCTARMTPPDSKKDARRRILGKAGTGVCALGVFLAGYMAMKTGDWRQMLLWTVLAAGCAWFASRFAIWGR